MLDRGLYMVSGTKHRYFIRRGPFQANEFSGVNVLSTLFLVNVLPSASRKRSHDSSVFQKNVHLGWCVKFKFSHIFNDEKNHWQLQLL